MTGIRVRRATSDDLQGLQGLWKSAGRPASELQVRFTEFQIAESDAGSLMAALGLRITGTQGQLHNGAIAVGDASVLESAFAERVETVAKNNGLTRLWIAPDEKLFPLHSFSQPDPEAIAAFSAVFGAEPQNLLTRKLRDEVVAVLSLDQEFALFRDSEKERTQKIFAQAKTLKTVATAFAAIACLLVMVAVFFMFSKRKELSMPGASTPNQTGQ